MGKFKEFINEGKVTVKKRDLIATKDIIKGLYKDNKITRVSVDIIVDAFTQEQYNKDWVAEVMPNIALILKGKSVPSYNAIIKTRSQQWGGTKKSYLAVLNSIGIQEISRGKFEFNDDEDDGYDAGPYDDQDIYADARQLRDEDAKISILRGLYGPSDEDEERAYYDFEIGDRISELIDDGVEFEKNYGESWRDVVDKLDTKEMSELRQSLLKRFSGEIAEYEQTKKDSESKDGEVVLYLYSVNHNFFFNGIQIGSIGEYHTSTQGEKIEEIFIKLIGKDATKKLKNGLSERHRAALFTKDGVYAYVGGEKRSKQYRFLESAFEGAAEYLSKFMEVSPELDSNFTTPGTVKASAKQEPVKDPRIDVAEELVATLKELDGDLDRLMGKLRSAMDKASDNGIPYLRRLDGNELYTLGKVDISDVARGLQRYRDNL